MTESKTFFSPQSRRLGTIGGVTLAILGVFLILGGVSAVQEGDDEWIQVVLWSWPLIFGLAEAARARRVAVVLTETDVVVRNEFRTRSVPWDNVEGVRWGPQSLTARAAWINRKKGRAIRSAAFRAFGSRAPGEYYDFVEAVQQRLTNAGA